MVLNQRPDRQRPGRSIEPDPVQEDVLREETRQLNVALPVGLHHQMKVAAAPGGDLPAGLDRPGGALLLCKCRSIGLLQCSKPSQPDASPQHASALTHTRPGSCPIINHN